MRIMLLKRNWEVLHFHVFCERVCYRNHWQCYLGLRFSFFINYKLISFMYMLLCSFFGFLFSCVSFWNFCLSRYLPNFSKSGFGKLQPSGQTWPGAYVFGSFHASLAKWCHCTRDHVPLKARNIYSLALYRKWSSTPDLRFQTYWCELLFLYRRYP